jgi:hypothetical protein
MTFIKKIVYALIAAVSSVMIGNYFSIKTEANTGAIGFASNLGACIGSLIMILCTALLLSYIVYLFYWVTRNKLKYPAAKAYVYCLCIAWLINTGLHI